MPQMGQPIAVNVWPMTPATALAIFFFQRYFDIHSILSEFTRAQPILTSYKTNFIQKFDVHDILLLWMEMLEKLDIQHLNSSLLGNIQCDLCYKSSPCLWKCDRNSRQSFLENCLPRVMAIHDRQ